MTYQLLVFDPGVAPRERARFLDWFEQEEGKPHSEVDPGIASPCLRRWYGSMIADWPNSLVDDADCGDDWQATEYAITAHAISADVRWAVADEFYDAARRLAIECGTGFYELNGDEGKEELYFPGDIMGPPSDGLWRRTVEEFRPFMYAPAPEAPKSKWFDFFRRKL